MSQGKSIGSTLLDFWQWFTSDLLNNTTRGKLAEFIAANALGIAGTIGQNWDSYDQVTSAGTTIEVKAVAFIQSWGQKKWSKIHFVQKIPYDKFTHFY